MKKKQSNSRRPSRLERIERKCDRILSELLIVRHQLTSRPDLDIAIDRLHRAARKMKIQCERERMAAAKMFHSKSQE